MDKIWIKRAVWIVVAGVAVAAAAWLAWPQAIPADFARVDRGWMEVTVDDDGKTEVRHVCTVSARVAGRGLAIAHPPGEEGVARHVGDHVTANDTVVAMMQPSTPGFLDVRTREEAAAAVAAADAAVKYAE